MAGLGRLTPLGQLYRAIDGLVEQRWTEEGIHRVVGLYYDRLQVRPLRPEERVDAREVSQGEW